MRNVFRNRASHVEISRVDLRGSHCLYYSKKVTEMGVQKFVTSKGVRSDQCLRKKYGHGQTLNFKKKQMQFGETRTDKHFEKQQNAVWRKRTNISKNRQMYYRKK